jgi:hypothetical protein
MPAHASSSFEAFIAFAVLFALCVAAAIASRGVNMAPKGYSLGCWAMSGVCLFVMALPYFVAGV